MQDENISARLKAEGQVMIFNERRGWPVSWF